MIRPNRYSHEKRSYTHMLVMRGGKPCAYLQSSTFATRSVLVPVQDEFPAFFIVDQKLNNAMNRRGTIYCRRVAMSAIRITDVLRQDAANSPEHWLCQRMLAAKGNWRVVPVRETWPRRQPMLTTLIYEGMAAYKLHHSDRGAVAMAVGQLEYDELTAMAEGLGLALPVKKYLHMDVILIPGIRQLLHFR